MSRKIILNHEMEVIVATLASRYRDLQWAQTSLLLAVEEHFSRKKPMQQATYTAYYVKGDTPVPYHVLYNMHRKVTRVAKELGCSREDAIKHIVKSQWEVASDVGKRKHRNEAV